MLDRKVCTSPRSFSASSSARDGPGSAYFPSGCWSSPWSLAFKVTKASGIGYRLLTSKVANGWQAHRQPWNVSCVFPIDANPRIPTNATMDEPIMQGTERHGARRADVQAAAACKSTRHSLSRRPRHEAYVREHASHYRERGLSATPLHPCCRATITQVKALRSTRSGLDGKSQPPSNSLPSKNHQAGSSMSLRHLGAMRIAKALR